MADAIAADFVIIIQKVKHFMIDDLVNNIGDLIKDRDKLALHAYPAFLDQVNEIINTRCDDIMKIEYLLDQILDYCFNDEVLALYKKLCRYLYSIRPESAVCYVNYYREMWEDA